MVAIANEITIDLVVIIVKFVLLVYNIRKNSCF